MTATKDEISDWFDRGVAQKATHMIVVCDTYGHEDYPCFANSDADARDTSSSTRLARLANVTLRTTK